MTGDLLVQRINYRVRRLATGAPCAAPGAPDHLPEHLGICYGMQAGQVLGERPGASSWVERA